MVGNVVDFTSRSLRASDLHHNDVYHKRSILSSLTNTWDNSLVVRVRNPGLGPGKGTIMAKKKRWDELTAPQKAGFAFSGTLQIVLLAAALWDIHHRSEEEIAGSKRMWTALAFVNFIGPIAYFMFGRRG